MRRAMTIIGVTAMMLMFLGLGVATADGLDPVIGINTDEAGNPVQTMPTLKQIFDLINENVVPQPCYDVMNGAADTGANDGGHGVDWPIPRFKDNENGTITDRLTKYVWLKNANCWGATPFETGISKAATLAHGQCALSDNSTPGDWHIPTINELLTLVDYSQDQPVLPDGHPFQNIYVYPYYYWSSTPHSSDPAKAWRLYMVWGVVDPYYQSTGLWVIPVRRLLPSDPDPDDV